MGVAETALAAGFSSFIDKYNPEREKLWIVERFGKIVGSVAIVERGKKVAQLRWLLARRFPPAFDKWDCRRMSKNC